MRVVGDVKMRHRFQHSTFFSAEGWPLREVHAVAQNKNEKKKNHCSFPQVRNRLQHLSSTLASVALIIEQRRMSVGNVGVKPDRRMNV